MGARPRRTSRRDPRPGPAGRDQGAHGDRAGPPRACRGPGRRASRWSRGSRSSRTPPSGRHDSIAVAGTHGKSTTAGWLVHVLVGGRQRTRPAFVGALLPGRSRRRHPGHGARGAPARTSSSRPTSTPATSTRTGRHVAVVTNVEWDHPDVFADLTRRSRSVRGLAAASGRSGRRPALVINVGDPGAAALRGASPTGPARSWRSPVASRTPVADGRGRRPSPAGGRSASGAIIAESPGGTRPSRSDGDALGGARRRSARDRRPPQRRQRAGGRRCRPGRSACATTTSCAASRRSRASGAAWSAWARPAGSSSTTTTATTPRPSARRCAAIRQREPGRRVWAVYEPLTYHRTAAMLDDFAEVLATADAAVDRRHLGRPRPGHDGRRRPRSSPSAIRRRRRRDDRRGAGQRRGRRPPGWHAHVQAGDAVLVMGGGRSYQIGRLLLEALAA